MPEKQQPYGTPCRAYIHRLPEPVEHKYLTVEHTEHGK